jgi:hypothetical protein
MSTRSKSKLAGVACKHLRGVVDDDGARALGKRHQLRQLLARGGVAGRVVGRAEEDDVCLRRAVPSGEDKATRCASLSACARSQAARQRRAARCACTHRSGKKPLAGLQGMYTMLPAAHNTSRARVKKRPCSHSKPQRAARLQRYAPYCEVAAVKPTVWPMMTLESTYAG